MGYKIKNTVSWAGVTVNYKRKRVYLKYPKKPDFLSFTIVILIISMMMSGMITSVEGVLLDILFKGFVNVHAGLLFIANWMIFAHWAFTKPHLRLALMKNDTDYNKTSQFYISGIKRKHVVLKNIGNMFTHYKASGDYSKYLERFKIKCLKYKPSKGLLENEKFKWEIHVDFSKVPKTGRLMIFNQKSDYDIVDGFVEVKQH